MLVSIADRVRETLLRGAGDLFLNKHYNPVYPLVSLMEDGVRRGDGNRDDSRHLMASKPRD